MSTHFTSNITSTNSRNNTPPDVIIQSANSRSDVPVKAQQIHLVAKAIWRLTPDQLPKPKYDALERILTESLTENFGGHIVQGVEGQFLVIPIKEGESYSCSLDTCMVTDAAFRCIKCKMPYCSKEHQRQDWAKHKTECISAPNK